jgi:dTDP-4-amino-4,6-dideoxygalactose transaminase
MQKSIGGFFPLEMPNGFAGNSNLVSVASVWYSRKPNFHFSSARGAILALKNQLESKTIWLPEIYCDVFDALSFIRYYELVEDSFDPAFSTESYEIEENDLVIVVDYFGVEPSNEFISFTKSRSDVHWVQDATQSLSPRLFWGDFTIFSPRKLFGVMDGGIVVANSNMIQNNDDYPKLIPIHDAKSHIAAIGKALDLRGQFADVWYKINLEEERDLVLEICKSSKLTSWQIGHFDHEEMSRKRINNFRILEKSLHEIALPGLAFSEQSVPFGFPISVSHRDLIQSELAKQGIYCAVHWKNSNLKKSDRQIRHEDSQLTLPCDHRYDDHDMDRLVTAVTRLLRLLA